MKEEKAYGRTWSELTDETTSRALAAVTRLLESPEIRKEQAGRQFSVTVTFSDKAEK